MTSSESGAICFNGAAVDERRKGDHLNDPSASCRSFNGAAVDERRKDLEHHIAQRLFASFNGAAVDERRKVQDIDLHKILAAASMGPPSMNGGRDHGRTQPVLDRWCFNGAAVDERRKVPSTGSGRPSSRCFNGAAVDERRKGRHPRPRRPHRRASMGPPSMNGGRVSAAASWTLKQGSFNGAAVDERRKDVQAFLI